MIGLLILLLDLFIVVLLVRAVLSWIPNKHGLLARIDEVVASITEPVLAPVRERIPPMGGLDWSFLVIVIGIYVVRTVLLSF